jgi:hypothetical protein
VPPGGCERNGWREIKRKLFEVNTRAVSRGQNELVGKFKMVVGDMVSIRGQVMEYTYIPKGMRSGVDCDWKG